jgi:hypothetical protein
VELSPRESNLRSEGGSGCQRLPRPRPDGEKNGKTEVSLSIINLTRSSSEKWYRKAQQNAFESQHQVNSQEEIFLLALSGLVGVNHVAKLSKLLDPARKKDDEQAQS